MKHIAAIATLLLPALSYAHELDSRSITVPRLSDGHSRVDADTSYRPGGGLGTLRDVSVCLDRDRLCVAPLVVQDYLSGRPRIVYEFNSSLTAVTIHVALQDKNGERNSGCVFMTVPPQSSGRNVDPTRIRSVRVTTYRNHLPDRVIDRLRCRCRDRCNCVRERESCRCGDRDRCRCGQR